MLSSLVQTQHVPMECTAVFKRFASKKEPLQTYKYFVDLRAEFPAATVDYDADSDSVDEFSSGDDAPLDFLDFDAEDTESQDTEIEAAKEEDVRAEDDLDDEESPIASTSGDGPMIEFAGIPSW